MTGTDRRKFRFPIPLAAFFILPLFLIVLKGNTSPSASENPPTQPSNDSDRWEPAHDPFLPARLYWSPGADSLRHGFTDTEIREKCGTCHTLNEDLTVADPNHYLNARLSIPVGVWREELNLSVKCGSCHLAVEPESISRPRWPEVLMHMRKVMQVKEWPVQYETEEWLDILHFYLATSNVLEELPADPTISGLAFRASNIGIPMATDFGEKIGNVNIVDLDRDGRNDILATDFSRNALELLQLTDTGWAETHIGDGEFPAKSEVFDFNGDGHLDIALAVLGSMYPTDDSVGSAVLLINDGAMKFERHVLIEGMGRMADVRPADFDNDGDFDFVIASFGFLKVGEIGWLEQTEPMRFVYHRLSPKAGGIHVIPTDINGDGFMDVIGLIAQEHEEIVAFMNRGDGTFRQEMIFKAFSPAFGSSGIELVDLDGDDDLDILYSNGDAVDLPNPMVLPYHGVQWLENKGLLRYEYHSIFSFYGAYRAVPGDLDGDGDIDVAAVTMITDWADSTRMSTIWLENDGTQHFTPHGIGTTPISLITLAMGDLDGDGDPDLVSGAMNLYKEHIERMGRITLWRNDGPMEDTD